MTDVPKLPMDTLSTTYGFEPREFKPLVKRLIDLVGSAVLLAFLSPLLLLIAAIVFTQVGPRAVFAHEREGKDGRKFYCLKFRTMFLDADERLEQILATDPEAAAEWEATRKLKNDTRIIPVIGSFLRKSSLDELPQLVNVLIGDMSLVGPRPVIEDEIAYYGDAAGYYYSVRPGMTGPWQVGARNDCDYDTRVAQDVDYVKNWSIIGDLKIIVKTAIMVLKMKSPGAY